MPSHQINPICLSGKRMENHVALMEIVNITFPSWWMGDFQGLSSVSWSSSNFNLHLYSWKFPFISWGYGFCFWVSAVLFGIREYLFFYIYIFALLEMPKVSQLLGIQYKVIFSILWKSFQKVSFSSRPCSFRSEYLTKEIDSFVII